MIFSFLLYLLICQCTNLASKVMDREWNLGKENIFQYEGVLQPSWNWRNTIFQELSPRTKHTTSQVSVSREEMREINPHAPMRQRLYPRLTDISSLSKFGLQPQQGWAISITHRSIEKPHCSKQEVHFPCFKIVHEVLCWGGVATYWCSKNCFREWLASCLAPIWTFYDMENKFGSLRSWYLGIIFYFSTA